MGIVTEKRCGICGETKPVEKFKIVKGKVKSKCLACHAAYNRKYSERESEARRIRLGMPPKESGLKKCFKCGQVKALAEFRKARLRPTGTTQPCLACHKTASKQYYQSSEEVRQRRNRDSKEWKARNRSKTRSFFQKWYNRNAESQRERSRRRRAEHPEDKRSSQARRKARQLKCQVNDFTREQWTWLLEQYDRRCAYCGVHSDKLQQDHVIPLSKGGNHTFRNVVPACSKCNQRKKDRTLEQMGMQFVIRVPV